MKHQLINHNCDVFFDEEDKSINGRDLTDHNNEPTFYSTKKRGLKKGWEQLEKEWNQYMTMYGAINILNKFNCQCHSYCAID